MLRTEGSYEFREAGITNVSVGTLHGQLDGKDGYRNSYYHWTDNSGIARSAAVCLEYVGGNANGISVLSLQPLGWYDRGSTVPELQFNSSNSYIHDGHWKTSPMIHTMQGGQHVKAIVTNNNLLGVTLQLQDVSTYYYGGWFKGIKYGGDCYCFQLMPGCSKSFDFYRFVEFPYTWQFCLDTPVSDAANVSVMFYSDWVPGMPPSRNNVLPEPYYYIKHKK